MRRFALVASLLLLASCEDVEGLPSGYDDICENGTVPWARHVTGEPAYDSTEIRDARDAAGVKIIDKSGTPCAKASDEAACNAAYAGVDPKTSGGVVFVGTRGNDVVVKSVTQLDASVLGQVDNPYEAAVLGVAGDRERAPLACDNGRVVGVKRAASGFEVAHIELDACTGRKTRIVTGVDPDGTTREISSESIFAGEPKVCD